MRRGVIAVKRPGLLPLPNDVSMVAMSKGVRVTLRLGLLLSAVGWGVALTFTFATWGGAADYMYEMGAGRVEYHPLLDYWLRMASVVMGCIGVGSLLAARKPEAYGSLIRLLGPFHVIVGVTLVVAAVKNGLRVGEHPTFIPDIVFCFLCGGMIWLPLILAGREDVPVGEDAGKGE